MKTILIDCRFAASNTGLGRYTREITRSLLAAENSSIHYKLLVKSTSESWIPAGFDVIQANIPHYSPAEQIRLPRIIAAAHVDLFFSPHFNVPLRCPVPFVVTIHDLILHRYPNNASRLKQIAYRFLIGQAVSKAKKIIAISHFVESEIMDQYGFPIADKVRVIHEGVDPSYHFMPRAEIDRIRLKYNLHKPFFLYVGNAKQHKNVRMLIDAHNASGRTDAELVLVTGGPEAALLEPLPRNVRFLRSVPDEDLPVLYSAAEACVTASLYEGFCLPVVEALACGCPVIATNRTAIPEVASGKAVLLEPAVNAFAQALRSPPLRQEPFVFGRWENAARKTQELLLAT